MNRSDRDRPILGALPDPQGTRFGAFVTTADSCAVRIYGEDGRALATHAMKPLGAEHTGYFEARVEGVRAGALYRFVLGERELPDPYARWLPHGVHGPAMVVAGAFDWKHGHGVGRPLEEQILYELHVGTFTPEGTYDAARAHLRELAELGVTTLQLMPIAAFPGARGWGYDGVALYAPLAAYGPPDALRRFIDEAHGLGLGVLLDVVYNHFGPAGNYLSAYAPEYFSHDHRTAWGDAPNFAHPAMRRYVLDNARYWLEELRFDGLRLDATHAIFDPSPRHVLLELRELADRIASPGARKVLIAEDERNEPAVVESLAMDAIWADDFHHHVHVTLTGERDGYYAAYHPGAADLARTLERGWFYEGQPFAPTGSPRGKSARGLPARAFVYCIQNHDQIGNRALGERLTALTSLDAYCAASALLLLLPMTPLLFMGQEWAATSPFLYFTDHDEELGHLVSAGRRDEFKSFAAFANPDARAHIPDPQALETFQRSQLRWEERNEEPHRRVLQLYRELLALRRTDPVFRRGARERLRAEVSNGLLVVRLWHEADVRLVMINFDGAPAPIPPRAIHQFELMWTSGARPHEAREPHEKELAPWTAAVWRGTCATPG
ncbi:malto-oligosyltrehalose trehalohydrolase [Pendulispora albinea]|uniref:Malto-oligosyltrehalose trehalohydrolase n=1 Tax=Pendulispora albinea TaxID=2741071 RepID=A0ABZ2LNY5_9BACT